MEMFDKITITARVSNEDCAFLAEYHSLKAFKNYNQTEVEYRSSNYSNISGIEIYIKNNKITLKTSLHKFWQNKCYGKLRNDNLFTISESKLAFEMLLHENRLKPENVYITQFEIGLNLNVSYEPLSYIELVTYILTSNQMDKEMFIDANYRKDRQRTTEKYKDIRKYFKIYDKGWQLQDKDKVRVNKRTNSEKILRIESCHKRYSTISSKFFSDSNLNRLKTRFYDDWKNINFTKKVTGKKGCRDSEVKRANILINNGSVFLLDSIKKDIKPGLLTKNHLRTVREFIRDFDKLKSKFNIVVSDQENEYNRLLFNAFVESSE